MITIEKTHVVGFEPAIRGMRNPKNSWDRTDSRYVYNDYEEDYDYHIGEKDLTLMKQLASGGAVHAKYRRMILVYVDITAPLYWWKEFDTYKVGTVANSCSTMHKLHSRDLTLDDFSCEHLDEKSLRLLLETIDYLNSVRAEYQETELKNYWWQMIQLLPTSYNQKRTVLLNYEVLVNMYESRRNHKLDEWHNFCEWIENLPYSELIIKEDCDDNIK